MFDFQIADTCAFEKTGMSSGRKCVNLRFLYVGWAVLETMLFGGVLNGWASLIFVLKEDGLYGDLCFNITSTNLDLTKETSNIPSNGSATFDSLQCTEQDSMLNLWFTIASALRNIFGIVIGMLIYRFGTRSARMTGWVFFIAGALSMAFTELSFPWLILPSLLTMSYGGTTLLITNVQLSSLFPHAAGVVVTLISGAFDFSATSQLAVKLLHEHGVSRMYSFIGFAAMHALIVFPSSLLFFFKDVSGHGKKQTESDVIKQEAAMSDTENSGSAGIVVTLGPRPLNGDHWEPANQSRDVKCQRNTEDVVASEKKVWQTDLKDTLNNDITQKRDFISLGQKTFRCTEVNSLQIGNNKEINGMLQMKTTNCLSDSKYKFEILKGLYCTHESGSDSKLKFVSIIRITSEEGKTRLSQLSDPVLVKNHNSSQKDFIRRDVGVGDSGTISDDRNTTGTGKTLQFADVQNKSDLFPTLKSCLTSHVFSLHVFWTSLHMLRLVSFFGLINRKLNAMFHGDTEKVSWYTNVFAYSMLTVMLVCWISGAMYDWQSTIFKGRVKEYHRRIFPTILPLALTSGIGVAISVMAMIDNETVLYVMFGLFVFYNAFIFGVCLSFLLRVFPERYFGILNGVMSLVSGSFCFLQYGIFRWHDAGPQGPLHANICMLSMVAASFIHPLYLFFKGCYTS